MGMSKKNLILSLVTIIAISIGAVAVVVLKSQGFFDSDGTEETVTEEIDILLEEQPSSIDPKKAEMMCESIINGTEPKLGAYNHPAMYVTTLGVNTIAVRVVTDEMTSDTYQKNAYWITGDQFADREAISMIRAESCKGKIPVVVIKMRPAKGLSLSRKIQFWNHYQPKPLLETWEDYDKKLNSYLRFLAPVPAIVVLEPDLLMFTFDTNNLQYGWLNDKYKEAFYERAQKVIKVMSRSWVYVDAGNAAYLKTRDNMEHMAKSLLRLDGLRGFSINTAHFFNTSFNNLMARRLHCLTGLHYITDTGRNGGRFSRQDVGGIEKCYFDPPRILRGLPPGWSWGTKLTPRQKRWSPIQPSPASTAQRQQSNSPSTTTETSPIIYFPSRNPPNPQEDPEGYNNYINTLRNNGAHSANGIPGFGSSQLGSAVQPQPNNHNNMNNNNNNRNWFNDLATPSGRVPVRAAAPPTKTTFRSVTLRTKEEALAIYRKKTMLRGKCIKIDTVRVHDANVWIKAPGESDGRLYPWGTYHKCLLGHSLPCDETCRLITHTEQRSSTCSCDLQNQASNAETTNQQQSGSQQSPGIFFPGPNSDSSGSDTDSSSVSYSHNPPGGVSSYQSLEEILQRG